MKTLTKILLIAAIFGLAAYAGQDLIINTARLDGFIYGNKSGGIDTIIRHATDSLGQYEIKNVRDPLDDLDAVNYRTLLAAGAGGLDSIPFNFSTGDLKAYFTGINFYTTNLDGRYMLISDSLESSVPNYVNWQTLNDSLDYVDSVIAASLAPHHYVISLPNAGTVLSRISSAIAGVDYPIDWVLTVGTSSVDLEIQHNLGKYVSSVTVFSNQSGTIRQQLFNSAAYNGIICEDNNNLRIQSLSTVPTKLYIYITFEQ